MERQYIQEHIKKLATLDDHESPVISCYLNLENDRNQYKLYLKERIRFVTSSLRKSELAEFNKAMAKITAFMDNKLNAKTRGVALFVRAGKNPFFLPLQFFVPLPNWFALDRTPNIYHLVELKDTYHRYVVVITTLENIRILGINCGAVTETLWSEHPELRNRIGREWTKEHYASKRQGKDDRFMEEKIDLLKKLMKEGGYGHLILAGNPTLCAQMKKALPKSLSSKLISSVNVSVSDKLDNIVQATIPLFMDQEEMESRSTVEKLKRSIYTNGLAVVGAESSIQALENDQVDTLIIAQEFDDSVTREKLVKLAVNNNSAIETVKDSYILNQYGGVGCLLRYLRPDQYRI